MTYAIQAIAGVAVALSAVAGVALRRTRRWLLEKAGIDPDAKRELDPPYQLFEAPDPAAVSKPMEEFAAADDGQAGDGKRAPRKRRPAKSQDVSGFAPKWPLRFGVAFLISLMAVGTLLVVAPLEIVGGNSADFYFGPTDVAPVLLLAMLVASCVMALALSLLRGRAYLLAVGLVFSVGVCFWLQAMFLDKGLPMADGNTVNWKRYDKIAIVSAIVWACVIALSAGLAVTKQKLAQTAFTVVSAALVLVQGAGVIAILTSSGANGLVEGEIVTAESVPTEEGLYEIGDKHNVILFVLDTYDEAFLEQAVAAEPTLLDDLTGFTWYTNPLGAMTPTRYGVPFLLTDERPRDDDQWSTYVKERYARSSFLSDIEDKGYAIGLYSTNLMLTKMPDEIARETVVRHTFNIHEAGVMVMSPSGTLQAMLECALYRDLPWVMKARFWFDTKNVSAAMVDKEIASDPANIVVTRNDPDYYKKLKNEGLKVNPRSDVGEFRVIHMQGTHTPYEMNAAGQEVDKGTVTVVDQAIGSMRIVEHYLNDLKEQGLYDDATIIITADHGFWYSTNDDLNGPATPIILAKPAQTAVQAAEPIRKCGSPVIHDDVPASIIDAIGADASAYAGQPLWTYTGDEDLNRPRYYLAGLMADHKDTNMVEYVVQGEVLNFQNWSKTGRTWDCQK